MEAYNRLVQQWGSRVRQWSIEVPINNQSGKYFLPDDQILRNKTVVAMFFWDGADVSPETGKDLADKNLQENSFLYLMSGADFLSYGSPLAAFSISDTCKDIETFYLDNFTPSKSYIMVGDGTLATAGTAYFLTFVYLD